MANKVTMTIEVNAKDASNSVNKLNQNLDETGRKVKEVGKGAEASKKGFGAMKGGVIGVGTALKASGIVAIFGLILNLVKQNQEVVDLFNKAMKALAIVFHQIWEAARPLREGLMSIFEDPKQAVLDLWNIIKENLVNRFNGILDFYKQSGQALISTFKAIGSEIKSLWDSDAKEDAKKYWAEAGDAASAAGESMIQAVTGVDNFVGKAVDVFKDLSGAISDAWSEADKLIVAQNNLKLAEAEYGKLVAANKAELEELKLIRDDETKSINERIEASMKADKIVNEQLDKAIKLQEEKIRLHKVDMDLTDTTIEDQVELMKLEADLDNLRAEASTRQRENLRRFNSLIKQQQTEIDASIKLVEDLKKTWEDAFNTMLDVGESEGLGDLNKSLEDSTEKFNEYFEKLDENYQNQFSLGELNKQFFDEQRAQIEQMDLTAEESAKLNAKLDEMQMDSKMALLDTLGGMLGQAASLFEENTAAYKVFTSAQIIMDTSRAIMGIAASFSTLGPVGQALAAIQIGITAALGAKQLAEVNGVKFARGGVLEGPSHAQGGILTPFGELEGGEGVINAQSMSSPSLRNLASIANVAGGGQDFSVGDGSVKLSEESLMMLASKINDKKVYVSETDITRTQQKVKVIEQEATI